MSSVPGRHRRYWALTLLCAAGALNLFDRQIVNILAQPIKTELRLSDTELGLLTGTAFGVFYALLGIPLGRLADRTDRVKLIAAALALWSVFTALCASTAGFLQLFVMRMGVGIGEAGSQPASTALIPDLFPAERRGSAMSMLLLGAPIGSFFGLALGGYVGSVWGWRMAFVVAGIPGTVLAVTMLLTLRDPGRLIATGRARPAEPLLRALQALATEPQFRWLALALTCSTFLVYASGAWFPPFFIRVHGLSTAATGWFVATSVGIGGGLGTLGTGVTCDLLRASIRQVESKLMLLALGLSIPTLLATVLSTDRTVALGAMFLFNMCAYGWLGPTVNLVQNAVKPGHRALAIAVCSCVASVLSLACGLPLVGMISDTLSLHEGQGAIRHALALCVPGVAVVGMLAHWRVLRSTADPITAVEISTVPAAADRTD